MPSKKISEHDLFVGPSITVKRLTFRKSDGLEFSKDVAVFRPGLVIVPVDDQKRVLLIHEFRPIRGGWSWRTPAGKMDKKGNPLFQAKRELLEEGGLIARHWKKIHAYLPEGSAMESITLFLATGLQKKGIQPEAYEEIKPRWVSLVKARSMAIEGKINHPVIAFAIIRAAHLLGAQK